MLKWIRWPGFLAFIAIVGGFSVLMVFFAGMLIKSAIEEYGSEGLGAQINVDYVRLSLSPLGFNVGRVQVTNPDAPMTNAAEIKAIAFEVEFWSLWMGQFVIDEMSVDGVRFNTPRSTSGALVKKAKEEEKNSEPSVLDEAVEELPSTDEMLAREPLQTDIVSEQLQVLYDERKAKIDELTQGLMSEEKLKAYQEEIEELSSGKLKSLEDFKQRKERLSQINKELKQEKEKISQAKEAYSSSYKELNAKLKELKGAPSQDLKDLKSKYRLDGAGATNLSRLLFGEQAAQWTTTTLSWYEKAKPYLEATKGDEKVKVVRKKGRYIHYGGVEALPEFLLREARIDVLLEAGHLDGKLTDLTHQPEVLRRPAKLVVNGNELTGYESIHIQGEFNHVDPENSFDVVDFQVKKMEVSDFNVSKDNDFALKLAKANANITGKGIVKNQKLDLKVDTKFSEAYFESSAKSGFARQVGELMEEIRQFTIDVEAKGNLKDLDTSIDSSLDKQLKIAFDNKIDAKQAEIEAELKAKLAKKLDDKAGKYSGDIQEMLKGGKALDAKKDEIENLANTKLTTWKEQQEAELAKKKAEEKAKLEAKKKAEKERAKKKAQEAAKEKLKNLF